jgi:hypothetical protein
MSEVTTRPTRQRALPNVLNEDISTAKTVTDLCPGVGNCLLQAEGGDMRYRTDGTAATLAAGGGFLVSDGQWAPDVITDPGLVSVIGVGVNILPMRNGPPLQS